MTKKDPFYESCAFTLDGFDKKKVQEALDRYRAEREAKELKDRDKNEIASLKQQLAAAMEFNLQLVKQNAELGKQLGDLVERNKKERNNGSR